MAIAVFSLLFTKENNTITVLVQIDRICGVKHLRRTNKVKCLARVVVSSDVITFLDSRIVIHVVSLFPHSRLFLRCCSPNKFLFLPFSHSLVPPTLYVSHSFTDSFITSLSYSVCSHDVITLSNPNLKVSLSSGKGDNKFISVCNFPAQ